MKKYTSAAHTVKYTHMGIIFIIKHFKQIALCIKPQADIAVLIIHTLNRAIVTGCGKRMAYVCFAHAMPESRLLEPDVHLHNIAAYKRNRKAAGTSAMKDLRQATVSWTIT
jgi:hypothetical protein